MVHVFFDGKFSKFLIIVKIYTYILTKGNGQCIIINIVYMKERGGR